MKMILLLAYGLLSVIANSTVSQPKNDQLTQSISIQEKISSNSFNQTQMRILQTQEQISIQTSNSTQQNTNSQQNPKTQCQNDCTTLTFYECSVCYDKCSITSPNSTILSFTMKSCTLTKCIKYESKAKDEEDSSSKATECVEYQTQIFSQAQCTQKCCNQPDYSKFTIETWQSCVEANASKQDSDSLIGVIIGTVLGSSLVIVIIIIVLCCCKDRMAVACQNCCWRFERLFNGKFVTKSMKRKQLQKKETKNPPQSQMNDIGTAQTLDGSDRKWTKIEIKKQVSQITSSKPMIQSSYKINPQIYCTICLDDTTNCKTKCGHNFHFQCLRNTIMKNKLKCPECDVKKLNPLRIICEQCQQKETLYSIDKKNTAVEHPNFYNNNKIICDDCLKIGNGQRERI